MALRWRFCGVASTIIIYVAGILILSIVNLQSPKRGRNGKFYSEADLMHNHDITIAKKSPLIWCTELKFLHGKKIPFALKTMKPMETFPGHYIRNHRNFVLENEVDPNQLLDHKDAANANDLDSSSRNEEPKPHPMLPKIGSQEKENLVALVSFPGSGNTWLRYLLQQATGILTGSVYKDYGLLKSGFPAENISNSSVLVIKTHEWGENSWQRFSRAILLVRDPAKAILAEFNRQSGGHIGFASPDRYKRTKGRYFSQFVTKKLWAWEQTNLSWAKNFTGDVLIVYYDNLVQFTEETLREVLNFIKYPINEDLMSCTVLRKEGIYRRKKRLMTFDPYSPQMRKLIESKRAEVYTELGRIKPII